MVDPRVARSVVRAALDNDDLLPGTRRQYLAASSELVRWIRPATRLIRCAQSVLADRPRLSPITVKRFFKWGRDAGLLWRVFHPRFSHRQCHRPRGGATSSSAKSAGDHH